MNPNQAIQNPENVCFNCLKETIVHKINIPALGWGSQFDNFSTRIQLCDNCYSVTNPDWWKLNVIKGKTDLEDEHYEYEDEILNFVNQMPLAGQELFWNRFASGAFVDIYMKAQDWIDYKQGILPYKKRKEYGLYPTQEKQEESDCDDESIIEWDEYGYPTQESLEKLEQILNGNDIRKAIKAFYSALKENYYPDCCGSTEVEVRGEIEKVWEYHTRGWSGNEDIIRVLENSWVWSLAFERYDAGGHYYFKPKKEI